MLAQYLIYTALCVVVFLVLCHVLIERVNK